MVWGNFSKSVHDFDNLFSTNMESFVIFHLVDFLQFSTRLKFDLILRPRNNSRVKFVDSKIISLRPSEVCS